MADHGTRFSVTFDGRAHELNPSGGQIILPAHGAKIHHDPGCGHLTDAHRLDRHPDEDGLLWRRLLDAEDPASWSASVGLLNGRGKPLTGVCSCALRPVTADHADGLPYWPLDEALDAFDVERHRAALEAADRRAEEIRRDFPLEAWPELPLERYALGVHKHRPDLPPPYCHALEYGSGELGSITGGSAKKHLIYCQDGGRWWHDSGYPDAATAWSAVRLGIVEAVTAAREGRVGDIDDITAVRAANTLIAKTLRIYAPDAIVPVYADSYTRHYTALLSDDVPARMRPFARKEYLRRLVAQHPRLKDWPPHLVYRFLAWWAPPRVAPRVFAVGIHPDGELDLDCLTEGYAAVGHDELGDLHDFADKEEFTRAVRDRLPAQDARYAADVWRLLEMRPGDRVVGYLAADAIFAVGRVTGDGYAWRSGRSNRRHTVAVEWDSSFSVSLDRPVPGWGPDRIAEVKPAFWTRIKQLRADELNFRAPQEADAELDEAVEDVEDVPVLQPLDPELQRVDDALTRRGQAILYGPPGTGKTYQALRYAVQRLGALSDDLPGVAPWAEPESAEYRTTLKALQDAGRLTLVTFHPSYGYEDFVEGLRPVKGQAGLALEPRPGVFKRVCEQAAEDPDHTYLVIVDEFNRGNVPKVLGELITVLEKDKRGLSVTLPLSERPFAVPRNVLLLGTMNTADRSIRMLDSAIRRRFAFVELLPDPKPLRGFNVDQLDLGVFLEALNARVRRLLDREKQIGHAFLMPGGEPVATAAELAAIVRDEIMPLLQEYAYDDYGLLASFLGEAVVDTVNHCLRDLDDESLVYALHSELRADADAEPA
ncbi:McrB family protein [Streptomyces sp. SJL17-1]|uniref:McrB family protein n=1 Tax=Streptomyces sp. SJL17-1 TaxID=2967223 RepID=UPI002966E54E|nr:AAA family ATPase [Streptomyces sp. SJL17-1]